MKLAKSKGMIIFLVFVVGLTIISAVNTKKFDERNKEVDTSYISMNIK